MISHKLTAAICCIALISSPWLALGQTLDWLPKSLDFGTVAQGATEYQTLTLFRTDAAGTPPLEVTDITFTYNQMNAFGCKIDDVPCESDGPLLIPITPDSPLELQLSFTPEDFSFSMATLEITNSSVNAPVLVYSILGEGAWEATTTSTKTTSTTVMSTTTTTLAASECGDPSGDGKITATDALFTLTAAIGIETCVLSVCDVNNDGKVRASDAAIILNVSIGIPVVLLCPV